MADGPRRAILLAAGRGRRLGPRGDERPKCLLCFGDRSLLDRHLDALGGLGLEEVVVVTGYRHQEVAGPLLARSPDVHRKLHNRIWDRGSLVSLASAGSALRAGGDVLLMDADVLYDAALLERLCRTPGTGLLVDRGCDVNDPEPVKVCAREGKLLDLSKVPSPALLASCVGESVGFFRLVEGVALQLADEAERRVQEGRLDEPYEDALRDVLVGRADRCTLHDITGMPWIEIDYPEDVERADREILPRISPERADVPGVHDRQPFQGMGT